MNEIVEEYNMYGLDDTFRGTHEAIPWGLYLMV